MPKLDELVRKINFRYVGFVFFLTISLLSGKRLFSEIYTGGKRALTYEPVEMTIHRSGVVRKRHKGIEYLGGGYDEVFYPKITYSYSVNGVLYWGGSDIYYDTFSHREGFSHGKAWDIARKYKPESVVSGYYNPKDPEESFLEVRSSSFMGMAILFFTFPLTIAIIIIRNEPDSDEVHKKELFMYSIPPLALFFIYQVYHLSLGGEMDGIYWLTWLFMLLPAYILYCALKPSDDNVEQLGS